MSKSVETKCITTEKWDPLANDYSQPRPNKLKGKNIYINNTQIRSNLVLQTPLMRTWGISIYVAENGETQGGYSMSLVFPNEGYETEETNVFKKKVQQFEEEVISQAYANRLAWFGDDDISLDTIRSGFYPMLKYPRMKDAKGQPLKKKDLTKAPTLKIRVNNYDDKWQCRVYDTELQPLFVPEDKDSSPVDFVTKNSMVITKIKCDGIWTGSAGISWGIKWNLQVCVVQPIAGASSDPLGVSDMDTSKFSSVKVAASVASKEPVVDEDSDEPDTKVSTTAVEDTDDEEEPVVPVTAPAPAPVVVEPPVVADAAPKKKIIKKAVVAAK
jgi:hypothetical protein